jgi:hypothetical protein
MRLAGKSCEADQYGQTSVAQVLLPLCTSLNYIPDGDTDPVERDKCSTSSPQAEPSTSLDLPDHQDPSASVGAPDKIPSTVFLDLNGNFSIFPPRPADFDHEETVTTTDNLRISEIPSKPTK